MRSKRINIAQNIYYDNVSVDDVYYNNEIIWPPRAYYVSNDGNDIRV